MLSIVKRYYSQKRYREHLPLKHDQKTHGRRGIAAALPFEEPVDREFLGGGISDANIITFSDGSKAVEKTTSQKYADNEVAAYKLDELLGLGVVPYTRYTDDGRGSVQRWVEGVSGREYAFQTDPGAMKKIYTSQKGYNLGVLDKITGQRDRAARNFLVDKQKNPVAIDNERMTYPGGKMLYRSPFVEANRGRKPSKEQRRRWERITYGEFGEVMDPAAIDSTRAAWNRFQDIIDNGI